MKDDGLREWFKTKIVREIKHDHLMTALGAFQHGDIFFILMEEAEETLDEYLKGEGTTFKPNELWKQVRGLAAGLGSLHAGGPNSITLYHMDLKPANILIVRKIMKISDFGLLQFKKVGPTVGDSRHSGVPDGHGHRPYASPSTGMYTRESDVWSLGAVISEIATFDIQKKKGVEEYRTDRLMEPEPGSNFGTYNFHKQGKLKNCVKERHLVLEARVDRSRRPQNREPLDPFQEQFFTTAFFPYVEIMLRYRRPNQTGASTPDVPVPRAEQVAKKIEEFCELAEKALKTEALYPPIQIPCVWDEIDNGTLLDNNMVSHYSL
jgi:serine/threonine protein kinase